MPRERCQTRARDQGEVIVRVEAVGVITSNLAIQAGGAGRFRRFPGSDAAGPRDEETVNECLVTRTDGARLRLSRE